MLCLNFLFAHSVASPTWIRQLESAAGSIPGPGPGLRVWRWLTQTWSRLQRRRTAKNGWQPDKQLKRNIAYLLAAAADDLAVFNASSFMVQANQKQKKEEEKEMWKREKRDLCFAAHVNAICASAWKMRWWKYGKIFPYPPSPPQLIASSRAMRSLVILPALSLLLPSSSSIMIVWLKPFWRASLNEQHRNATHQIFAIIFGYLWDTFGYVG